MISSSVRHLIITIYFMAAMFIDIIGRNQMVRFSHNWNGKLDCEVFTTIRRWTPEKEKYYQEQLANIHTIFLKDRPYTKAKLIDIDVMVWDNVRPHTMAQDTGMTVVEAYELFKKFGITEGVKVIILTFKRGRGE